MDNLAHLEFLSGKSKELIEKQVNSYRQQHSYAGTIIGVTALFIPFFLNGLDESYPLIQYLSVIPIAIFIWAILIMLNILRSRPLDQAFSVEKYQQLANSTYKEILIYEIGANTSCYRDNRKITDRENNKYNTGVWLTTIGIIFSIILLLTNIFIKPEKLPTKVEILNQNKMTDKPTVNPETIVIPAVPPADRERMNEGVAKPQSAPQTTTPPPKEKGN